MLVIETNCEYLKVDTALNENELSLDGVLLLLVSQIKTYKKHLQCTNKKP